MTTTATATPIDIAQGETPMTFGMRRSGTRPAAPATPKPAPAPQAGPLRSATTMTLQTRTAAGLWFGRKDATKANIASFPNFAAKLRSLEQSVVQDDPYADWHFLQIETAIQENKGKLKHLMTEVERFTANGLPEGIDVSVALSQAPETIELRFNSTLAIQTAFLVAEFDQLARKCLLARHLGLISRDTCHQWMAQGLRLVRSVMHKGTGWKFTGVTRDDMAANNQRAQLAVERMGLCPADILSGERRSAFAPVIRRKGNLGRPVDPSAADDEGVFLED